MVDKKNKRRGRHIEHKPIKIIETGEIFETYSDAAKSINGHKGDILLCLRGLRRRHKGYSFMYVDGK